MKKQEIIYFFISNILIFGSLALIFFLTKELLTLY